MNCWAEALPVNAAMMIAIKPNDPQNLRRLIAFSQAQERHRSATNKHSEGVEREWH